MPKIPLLSDELDAAAAMLEKLILIRQDDTYAVRPNAYPRAVNLLRAKAAALRGKGKPKPKRKTVVGYVGSRHTKIKVQGLFEDEDK